MIDFRPLFKPSFWFTTTAAPLTIGAEHLLFIVFAAFLVLGAITRMVAGRRKEDLHVTEVFSRLGHMGVAMGMIGLMIFFCSFEEIPLLGARFWYLFWGIGLIFWIATVVRYVVKIAPAERAEELARQERMKYLPKPKA